MKYFSSKFWVSEPVGFREALLKGQAQDKGLYFPSQKFLSIP